MVALAVAAFALAGCVGGAAPGTDRPLVILYGDSLSWEAGSAFESNMGPGANVVHRSFPGVAACDLLPSMAADVATLQPEAVVIEFAGNMTTPCMHGTTSETVVARYARDVADAAAIFSARGIPVYLMGAPLLAGWGSDQTPGMHAAFTAIADKSGLVSFTDAGRSVLDAEGAFTMTLPCLPGETAAMGCVGGRITVRSPDRVHFCPVATSGACPVWSSGAWRFGAAMAAPVRRDLGL
jgi:hypothetical protein